MFMLFWFMVLGFVLMSYDVVCVIDAFGVVCDVECCVVYWVWVFLVCCNVVGVGVWCGVKTQDY